MAGFDDNWQTKCSIISERTKFIFNNELLSDVKFVVTVANSENTSKKTKMTIPAHKFVLAISSPVFYAMFYGQMAETTDSVELPDCEYESLLELFRYLYSDEVSLTGSNVIHILYLAKKYMVPSLAGKCTEYLRDHLEASNVFTILPHAQKFEDKDLEEQCWEVVEMHTEEAVTSDEFVTLERSLVESVVKREILNVKEEELFKAVDRWATKESERQGLTADGEVKRRILGEDIVRAVRFPLMSQKEFVSVVFDCGILTKKEIADMMKHYSDVSLNSPLPFIQFSRKPSVQRYHRFTLTVQPDPYFWSYYGPADALKVTVNKSVRLHGVQHFGSAGGEYTVSIEIKDATSGSSLVKQSGSYSSEKDEMHDYYGFDVMFDNPVHLERDKTYMIVSLIQGPKSWYGENGKESIECKGVQFTLSNSDGPNNGTTYFRGQFSEFLFSC